MYRVRKNHIALGTLLLFGMLLRLGLNAQEAPSLMDVSSERATGKHLKNEWNLPPTQVTETDLFDTEESGNIISDPALYYSLSEKKLEDGDYILQAYQANPARKEIWIQVLEFYGISGNHASEKMMAKKITASSLVPKEVLDYHRLLVRQMNDGDLIISHGTWDTAALQVAISESGRNVKVMNLQWFRDPSFMGNRLKDLGISAPELRKKASATLLDLKEKNPQLSIHVTISQNTDLIQALKNDLVFTGLSFQIGSKDLTGQIILDSWNELKNYEASVHSISKSSHPFMANYLPLLIEVESYASTTGQVDDATLSRTWINGITDRLGMSRIEMPGTNKE